MGCAPEVWSARGPWCVILAGGDGKRLLPLTRQISGDDRPKQFCRVIGGETLLEQTRRRAARIFPSANTIIVLTRSHARYFAECFGEAAPPHALVQPENRGTAAAIVWSLAQLRALDPEGLVAFFPSDHYIGNGAALAGHMAVAFSFAARNPSRLVLLGIAPTAPETSYGWIEPGEAIDTAMFSVRRFWEKPASGTAARLLAAGCLWNSFIMAGRIGAFWELTERAVPWLATAFAECDESIDSVYAALPCVNFPEHVLAADPDALAVVRADDLDWTDLGEPERVLATLARQRALAAATAAGGGAPWRPRMA